MRDILFWGSTAAILMLLLFVGVTVVAALVEVFFEAEELKHSRPTRTPKRGVK